MKNLIKIFLEGAYGNFKKIFFAKDRVTDLELRNAILTGTVEAEEKVAKKSCIGCGGCANACPTSAITMKKLNSAEWLSPGWSKSEIPDLDPFKCVHCYYCHDFCPIYALYSEAGAIHPNAVGDFEVDTKNIIDEPFKISEDKIKFISQFLSDKTILKNKKSK
ncbi:4Fe-4S dicluster domain-containing protein [Methanobrevibacter sp. DSM 116169]|uniref:4Fe-4S dicluster domain-containing protein n=1 Tax=Methanobrevibacter sp. DSM 116169 TaxID=3242727 RepID=UPI0038FBE78C